MYVCMYVCIYITLYCHFCYVFLLKQDGFRNSKNVYLPSVAGAAVVGAAVVGAAVVGAAVVV